MPGYIHHVTLTTGHVRRSPRSEVGDDVLRTLAPLLDRALTGERVPISAPPAPGVRYSMSGGVQGRCCAVTLWGERGTELAPILTTHVAAHSRCGAGLWRDVHARNSDAGLATDPAQHPPAPWCADLLHVGAALHREALAWTGDWARSVAWCWIEAVAARGSAA